MAASTSGFLPRSSDLNLRERKDRFVGTENLDEFLKDEFEDAKDASKTTQKNIISCFYKASLVTPFSCDFIDHSIFCCSLLQD